MIRKRDAKTKRDTQTNRDKTLNKNQDELMNIASKLKSLGHMLENLDDAAAPGLGLILSELSAQVEEITDRLDPVTLV